MNYRVCIQMNGCAVKHDKHFKGKHNITFIR